MTLTNLRLHYCKHTFIRVQENFARFARTPYLRIFLVANQTLNIDLILMKNAQSRTLLAVNQFIKEKLRNKVVANKKFVYSMSENFYVNLSFWFLRRSCKYVPYISTCKNSITYCGPTAPLGGA
jgi:hypothetical protein